MNQHQYFMNINELALKASQLHSECTMQLDEWMSRIEDCLHTNYSWDDVHIDIWNKPDWLIEFGDIDYCIQIDGVRYDFMYTDSYDSCCDRSVSLYIYDKWLNMEIADVCSDIVYLSKRQYEKERMEDIKEIQRKAQELNLRLEVNV